MRAVLYRRVSTEDQQLGMEGQLERLEEEALRRGWSPEVVTDHGVSGKVPADERPALGPALAGMRAGDVLAVARLDRLSRSMLDFAGILDRAQREGWSIVALDLGVDMTTPNGRLIAHILVAVAEWERQMIGQRIREGLAQSTKTLGRVQPANGGGKPAHVPDSVWAVVRDAEAEGLSPGQIARRLNDYGMKSPRGKRWHRTSVGRMLARADAAAA